MHNISDKLSHQRSSNAPQPSAPYRAKNQNQDQNQNQNENQNQNQDQNQNQNKNQPQQEFLQRKLRLDSV